MYVGCARAARLGPDAARTRAFHLRQKVSATWLPREPAAVESPIAAEDMLHVVGPLSDDGTPGAA
jgi:hypothetical protein